MAILPTQRHLFDIPESVSYFNCAYNGPQLLASKAAMIEGVSLKCQPWNRISQDFFEGAERVRVLAAQTFGGDVDGYALIPAASYGLSTAARILEAELTPEDEIIVLAEAFPSHYLPWERVAQMTRATLRVVEREGEETWAQAIIKHLSPRVKAVAVSSCHWTDGAVIDLVRVGKACREIGAMLAVDATQSLGATPLDFDRIQPDFVVAAGYKWLLAPYGFGLMYVSPRYRDARPLEENWQSREHAEVFERLAEYSPRYMAGARRFDVGEKNTEAILPGAIAALEQLALWGVANIAETLEAMNKTIADTLTTLGYRIPDTEQRSPHMLGVSRERADWSKLLEQLAQENIYISQRGDALRFAPHLHNTPRDVDRLLECIKRVSQ